MTRERALISAARSGDRAAFDHLLREHLPALRARVRSAVRHRPDLDPEEIIQQTLVRSFEAFGVFDDRYRFGQYLFGIAKYILRRQLCAGVREIPIAWEDAGEDDRLPSTYESLSGPARALAGVDRFPEPDRCAIDRARLCELLEAILLYGGYPHQQIAFAFGTVLWGKRTVDHSDAPRGRLQRVRPDKRPITSDPDRVVRELSDLSLVAATAGFRSVIEASEGLSPTDLDPAFTPFDFRLGLRVRELFARDAVSGETFAHLGDRRVGQTRLSDYYGQNPRRSVADWIAAIKRRTEKYLSGHLDLTRSTIPMPGGHGNLGGSAVRVWKREEDPGLDAGLPGRPERKGPNRAEPTQAETHRGPRREGGHG